MNPEFVRTSERGWLEKLAKVYGNRSSATIEDDAGFGIDPTAQTLFEMARRAKLSRAELVAVCVACGMSVAGVGIVVLAFLDPEPTTKLGLMVGGGIVCILGGGFTAIHILTQLKPPNITIDSNGACVRFDLNWN